MDSVKPHRSLQRPRCGEGRRTVGNGGGAVHGPAGGVLNAGPVQGLLIRLAQLDAVEEQGTARQLQRHDANVVVHIRQRRIGAQLEFVPMKRSPLGIL